ncbi:hypothetical protein LLG96_01865 [bacterium]|nr:hypothetical protein [bacterium]
MKRIFVPVSIALLGVFMSCGSRNEGKSVPSPHASVTFAVFGNTGRVTDDGAVFRELSAELKDRDVDFAVDLGNRVPVGVPPSGVGAMLMAVQESLKTAPVPVYPVAGPDDVFDYTSDVAYSTLYGPAWYSFERGGALFIVLDTEDESYRSGFGVTPKVSSEQLAWLSGTLANIPGDRAVVVFMNRPLWKEAPGLWNDEVLPVLKSGDTDLIVSCYEQGLCDWGEVNGIRTISTGCTGPVSRKGVGLFPHIVMVTMDGENSSFRILTPGGTVTEGTGADLKTYDEVGNLVRALTPPVLKTERSWTVSETVDFTITNPFDSTVSGGLSLTVFDKTDWTIDPASFEFTLNRGEISTFHMLIRGKDPELSPVPEFHAWLRTGDRDVADFRGMLLRQIPKPRTGETIPIAAHIADRVPYSFDRKPLRIPVEIEGPDLSGRLIIYRDDGTEMPVCVHISNLRDFRIGLNEFTWNGTDLEGRPGTADSLSYYIVAYNKAAPPTWVGEGPPSYYGAFTVERGLSGIAAKTHTDDSLVTYRIPGQLVAPEPEKPLSVAQLLDGLPITGYTSGDKEKIYVTTSAGLVCAFVSGGVVRPDVSFGDQGYVSFTGFRGRTVGNPSFNGGMVYVGTGGGNGSSPAVLAINGENGEIVKVIPLGDYFGEEAAPPAVTATERGIYAAHPDCDYVLLMNNGGEILWVNEPGDLGGDKDADGRSFTYGIGSDQYGFSYVNTPGTSARCAVLGPDGRTLFRVILVVLPGLRVSGVTPMIEEKNTDGLYFVTRGADKPYVFHVPYTIKAGTIVDENTVMKK